MSNKKDLARRFGRAEQYDEAAHIQKRSADLLINYLGTFDMVKHRPPQRILELGCGTGYLSAQLVRLFPQAHYYLSDIAPDMLRRTQKRLHLLPQTAHPPIFLLMDAEAPSEDLPDGFDLIISNLCIQWFSNHETAFARLAQYLAPGGMFLATTLLKDSLKEWRQACAMAQTACGVPHYPDINRLSRLWPLSGYGQWSEHWLTDPAPSALAFLRGLHQIGASQPHKAHHPANPASLIRAIACFDQHYRDITYHLGLGLFIKDRT